MTDDLFNQVTAHAAERDLTFSEVVRRATENHLRRAEFDNARLDRPDGPTHVEISQDTGGQGGNDILVDGVVVPNLRVHPVTEDSDVKRYSLALDGRFATEPMTWGELWPQVWFLANAMAVAAGYSCHGPDARFLNRHGSNENPGGVGHHTIVVNVASSLDPNAVAQAVADEARARGIT